jgi:membrane protein DedA with SNARE-associated domain
MLHDFMVWLVQTIGVLGYPGIVVLMAIESSFFPLPSEIVIPPAGFLVAQGRMSMVLVILAGTVGSVIGAWVNYALAATLGRKVLLKWGKWFFISEEKFLASERFFRRHGEIGTFIGRLLPVVRHLISFPAGLARMSLPRFTFFTAAGAALWVTILAIIGYLVGENRDLVQEWSKTAAFWVIIGCTVLIVGYVKWKRHSSSLPS